MKRLLFLALVFFAGPALAQGVWSPPHISMAGGSSVFSFDGDDAANAQPALSVLPGPLWVTAEIGASAVSVSLYSCPATGNASQAGPNASGSNDPATDCTLLTTIAADTRYAVGLSIGAGQVLDVDIDTDGDGGSIFVAAAGLARSSLFDPFQGRTGTVWLRQAGLTGLAPMLRAGVEPITGATNHAGYEGCFNDFTNAWDYSVTRNGAFNGATAAGTSLSYPALVGFLGTATYDPANLVDGAGATTTITVTGAALGDMVEAVSFSLDLQGITLTAWVSASNTVSVRFQNETGGDIDLLSGTLTAHVRESDPGLDASTTIPASWGRFDIGSPATVTFFGRRASGVNDEIDARVLVSVGTNATGVVFYNPYCGFGTSTGTESRKKLIFGAWRVRRDSGTLANGCIWVGWTNTVLGAGIPLTTTCTASATANDIYLGVRTDTSGNLRVVMNQAASAQVDFDSGYDWPSNTTFVTIEAVGFLENDGSADWTNGWIDFYANGKLLKQTGRSHSLEPSDMSTAFNPATNPMSVGLALVRISATPVYQWDYVGAYQSRILQSTSP